MRSGLAVDPEWTRLGMRDHSLCEQDALFLMVSPYVPVQKT
jgi:hypothetical protein